MEGRCTPVPGKEFSFLPHTLFPTATQCSAQEGFGYKACLPGRDDIIDLRRRGTVSNSYQDLQLNKIAFLREYLKALSQKESERVVVATIES